jgi:catechol 2,3-dioxygenase-like lactoylglutathione lyase family enzyme
MIAGGNVTLSVADLGRALRFYIETLGMKLVEESPGWAVLDAGEGFRVGLRVGERAASMAPSATTDMSVGFKVKGRFDDAIAVFENRGIAFEKQSAGKAKVAAFVDPDGNPLYLYGEEPRL